MAATKRKALHWTVAMATAISIGAAAPAAATTPLPPLRPAVTAAGETAMPQRVPLPPKRPHATAKATAAYAQANVGLRGAMFASRATFKPMVRPVAGPFSIASTTLTSSADIAALKRVFEAAHKGRDADADAAARTIADPVARKLAEWGVLRSHNTSPAFKRYADFVAGNPDWPHVPLFRRRAENALWNDRLDDATVLAFFGKDKPTTAKGRYMLARALLAKGDRAGAAELVRAAWRYQDSSADVETTVLAQFGELLTRTDHKIRMDKRFYVNDTEGGMRAAQSLGGNELAVARAWTAVIKNQRNAKALLDVVPAQARRDAGYIFVRTRWLRRDNKLEEAARLILTAPKDAEAVVDPDQWWQERRVLVRSLLDRKDYRNAYRVAVDAVTPERENFRVGKWFTAGWVALRYLNDPKTAAALFAHIPKGTDNPHALSRGGYWQGRAAEAMGQRAQAKTFYEKAGVHSATYYGQLARARLGLTDLGLKGPPIFTAEERKVLANLEVVRAAEILYTIDERNMLASIFAEIGESGTDIAGMSILAEVAAKHNDGRAMLLLGRLAHGRNLPLDYYAYPTFGLPDYTPVAPPVEDAVVYSIARQESHFSPHVVSSANAMGLMQVTPIAAQDTSKRFKVPYNRARLLSDPVYNMQMGAAELSMLLTTYDGSYVLAFAAYNAGRGRIRQWIGTYGDPRDPSVDPVDWVERLPFAETRNYVMRIMENLQVYRALFGGGSKLMIEADIRRGKMN